MEPVQKLDPRKEQALAYLLAEVDAASEVVLGKRDVLGRVPGFYAGLASGTGELPPHLEYPGGKGGKRRKYTRKQRGGAACDNKWVSLAVDSGIVLAGAAAVVGSSYVGFQALSYYMATYEIPDATIAIITTVYDTLKTLLTDSVPALASGAASGVKGVLSGLYNVASALMPVAKPGLPAVGIYRYLVQGVSASDDAARIVESVSTGIRNTKEFAEGVVTRSRRKKQELQASIAAKSQEVRDALTQARDAASAQAFRTMNRASNLKEFICGLIDGAANKTLNAADAVLKITQFFADLRRQDDERVHPPVGAAAAFDDGPDSPRADSPRADYPILPGSPRSDSSRPGSPIPPDSPRLGSPIPPGSPRSDDDEDDEDEAASRRLREILQGGKRHRKRTMHKRSKKHHKGKKSRKHMHRRR